ncbi:MAG: type II toxin-antitoxin system MqsR family toxin [Desulfomonile sp.]|nr:type II toxin-antitoxin system MqsR family toxin [Desulfomonile sp.]
MRDVVLSLNQEHFHKSMTTDPDRRYRQDASM